MPVICITARVLMEHGEKFKQAIIESQMKFEDYGSDTVKRDLDVFLSDDDKLKFISLFEVESENLGVLVESLTQAHNYYLKVVPGFEYELSVGYDHDEFMEIEEKTKKALA